MPFKKASGAVGKDVTSKLYKCLTLPCGIGFENPCTKPVRLAPVRWWTRLPKEEASKGGRDPLLRFRRPGRKSRSQPLEPDTVVVGNYPHKNGKISTISTNRPRVEGLEGQ